MVVLASVSCSNSVVQAIGEQNPDVILITHQHGCDHAGADRQQVLRTLTGTCNNPNVCGVLLVGLGCEGIGTSDIAKGIDPRGRIVKKLEIQAIGDIEQIVNNANKKLKHIKEFAAKQKRVTFDINELVVGLECGASDPFSGITANPVVGAVSDRLVAQGATTILSEIPELVGAEPILEKMIKDRKVRECLFEKIEKYVEFAKQAGNDIRGTNPTPGNIASGISTLEEKSLGAVIKGGHSVIIDVIDYAKVPTKKGLNIMDTPGNDAESVTGMVSGGAVVVLFTTGLGTPLGNPVAPVIKISSNTKTYNSMNSFIDFNAGRIQDGENFEAVVDDCFDLFIDVCNGKKVKAEENKCREFAINRIGPTF